MFEKAKWIWLEEVEKADEYASFLEKFNYNAGKAIIRICAEINYIVYINGKRVGFGQFPNYLEEKYVDTLDITQYCQKGMNSVRVVVHYEGIDTLTHIKDKAGVIFEIVEDGNVTAFSSKDTLGGYDNAYMQHVCRLVTWQMGYSVNMVNSQKEICYKPCREVNMYCVFLNRPVKKLVEHEVVQGTILDIKNKHIFDFEREVAGHIILDVECAQDTTILVAYGEHIADGEVRQIVSGGDYSFEFQCTAGRNFFELLFFRVGARYLEIKNCDAVINLQVGIVPVMYSISEKSTTLKGIDRKIYDTCVRTLRLCMHEHYEDCPWREQALYCLDSRNQMLAGYCAFEETEFARANIVFMSKGKTKEGLLEMTFPAVNTPSIPFFTLMYPVIVYEYIEHTGDLTILDEVMDTLTEIMEVFISRVDSLGLIQNMPSPYWNFYEWSNGSQRSAEDGTPILDCENGTYDLMLNCAFIYAFERYRKLCKFVGRSVNMDVSFMQNEIRNMFYDEDKGYYSLSNSGSKLYGQLGNAFAKLAGLSGRNIDKAIKGECDVIPATLSMRGFVYDALLSGDKDAKEFILADIREKYTYMLDQGATAFWETLDGETAFENGGSLCHGWSAMPIYYYNLLGEC